MSASRCRPLGLGLCQVAPEPAPKVEGHVVSEKDRDRVRCQHPSGCAEPAVWSSHLRWSTAHRSSVSFYYTCEEHSPSEATRDDRTAELAQAAGEGEAEGRGGDEPQGSAGDCVAEVGVG